MTTTAPRLLPGIDLVEVAEVGASIERFGDRYLRRVHRAEELTGVDGMSTARRDAHLAGRFAAKEAVYKALRMPAGTGMPWPDIQIGRCEDGAPTVQLHGAARHWAHLTGIDEVVVSITHDTTRAMAIAIAHHSTPPTAPVAGTATD